jgi:hypothetical protein
MKQEISKPLMFGVIGALVVAAVIGGYFFVNRTEGNTQAAADAQKKIQQERQSGNAMAGYGGTRGRQGQGQGYGQGYGGRPGGYSGGQMGGQMGGYGGQMGGR